MGTSDKEAVAETGQGLWVGAPEGARSQVTVGCQGRGCGGGVSREHESGVQDSDESARAEGGGRPGFWGGGERKRGRGGTPLGCIFLCPFLCLFTTFLLFLLVFSPLSFPLFGGWENRRLGCPSLTHSGLGQENGHVEKPAAALALRAACM